MKNDKKCRFLTREGAAAWMFMGPALIIIFGMIGFPLLKAFFMSLQSLSLKRPNATRFIAFGNYIQIFKDLFFWKTLGRTLVFMCITLVFEFTLGIALALFLNTNIKGRRFLQTIIIIPWAIPVTVNALMWKWIFNASYGSWNALLTQLGIIDGYRSWLGDPVVAMLIIIAANIWKAVPIVTFLTLAALQTIPESLYEVAELDGAKPHYVFWKITFFMILPMLMVTLILKTVDAFKVFDLIFVLTSGGPYDGTKTIAFYTYEQTFSFLNFGKGAALAFIMTIIIGIFAFIYYKVMDRDDFE
jgi:ABC-type sugar transport system permease subunit